MLVFAGSSNLSLARKIARRTGLKLGRMELSRFDNDEARVWIKEKDIGDKCVVVQSLSQPTDHNLVELLLICDALKRKGVKKIIGIVPWLGYSKQDKVFREGEPLSIEVVAKILKVAGLSKLITIDLHNEKIKKYFRIPVVNLSATKVLANEVVVDKETVVVAPDKGAVDKSKKLAKLLKCPVVLLDKVRDLSTGEVSILGMRGEVKGKKAIIIDDLIVTGGTLIKTAKYLRSLGVQSIKVLVTHHLYVKGVQRKLDKRVIDRVVATDTVEVKEKSKKLKIVSVVDELSRQIGS
jgi:ribose-phosphate pyrophosphokinase